MSRILVTGGLGALGTYLVPRLVNQGNDLTLMVRPTKKQTALERTREKFPGIPLEVMSLDVLDKFPADFPSFDSIWHAAAILDLGESKSGEIWHTNVDGTWNMISLFHQIDCPEFNFISTAYTQGRNTYERSKVKCEEMLAQEAAHTNKAITVFKPSIIIGTPKNPGPIQGVTLVAKAIFMVHRKAEKARRFVQEHMLLPAMEPVLRLPGDPDAHLNIIPVDVVVNTIIRIVAEGRKSRHFYITNPNPPTVNEVAHEIGEAFDIDFRIERKFKASILERVIRNQTKALSPYLWEDQMFDTEVDPSYTIPGGYTTELVSKSFNPNSIS